MLLHSCVSFCPNAPSFTVILCKVKSFPRELLKPSFSLHSYPHNSVHAFSSDIVLDAPSPVGPEESFARAGTVPVSCSTPVCQQGAKHIYLLFCFVFLTVKHIGSELPDQGLNPCPCIGKCRVLTPGPLGKSHTLTF